jgi:thiol-disulfide isomerase/thioredoxin
MRLPTFILAVTASLSFVTANYASEYTAGSFEAALGAAADKEASIAVCKEFMQNSPDIDVLRAAQDGWKGIDAESLQSFCDQQLKANPKSAQWTYLCGRLGKTTVEKLDYGRKAISLDGKWPYGYRLLCATYVSDLFDADPASPGYADLKKRLKKDGDYFEALAGLAPTEEWAQSFYHQYLMFVKDYKAALRHLEAGREAMPRMASPTRFAEVYACMGKLEKAYELHAETTESNFKRYEADTTINRAELQAAKENQMLFGFAELLTAHGEYDALEEWLEARPNASSDKNVRFLLAQAAAGEKETDEAIDYINQAAALGFDDRVTLYQTDEFKALGDIQGWKKGIDAIEANWTAGAPVRKARSLSQKISKSAPDWELPTPSGEMVKFADLRGGVVILDFWATWCGPCRMSMPVLNRFVKEKLPPGVRVFSVNVWENAPEKAKAFMADNDYRMELVFGNKALTEAYGITGIPYICAVDKQGNIRFEAKGYSDALEEDLVWWTEDLLNERAGF